MYDENRWGLEGWEIPIDEIIIEEIIGELRKISQNNSETIAAAFSEGAKILYSTDNWDIKQEIKNIISHWKSGKKAQFITLDGIRYSILLMERERIIAVSISEPRYFTALKSKYKYFLFLTYILRRGVSISKFIDTTFGNLLKLWKMYFGKSL